ncbi:MAG: hypothetical protein IKA68_03990, partial [Clostridia bacterium]|nr:hypothetical protein [Clostridia bacterium]
NDTSSASFLGTFSHWRRLLVRLRRANGTAKDGVSYKMGANFYVLSVGADSISALSSSGAY